MTTIPTPHQMLTSAQSAPTQEATGDTKPALPVKKGILSVSAVVASLPEDTKLTPSLLEFIERVATPTTAAKVVTGSSSSDSEGESGGGGDHAPQQQTAESWSTSFPVHVTLAFQFQPSTVYLTYRPHSRVECTCIIQSPGVNFVVPSSLSFCPQGLESAMTTTGDSPPRQPSFTSAGRVYWH